MHTLTLRADGLYVVDDAIPVATKAEKGVVDYVIGRWGVLFRRVATSTGVPWAWLVAFCTVESGGNPNARSGAGAIGLMQIMPKTYLGARPQGSVSDLYNPTINAQVGGEILATSRRKGLNIAEAASEYNAGPGPHPSSKNDWGMRMDDPCVPGDCYADRIIRAYNYVVLRTLRVMLLGDSMTKAVAPFVAASTAGLPVRLVGREFDGVAHHEGIVGESIAKIRARFAGAVASSGRPDVVIVLAGANDVPGSASPSAMAAAEGAALDEYLAGADAVLSVPIPPQPAAVPKGRGDVPAAYDAALAGEVGRRHAAGKPVVVLDPGFTAADVGPDGVHLTVAGNRKLADAIANALAGVARISRPVEIPDVGSPWYRHPVVLILGAGAVGFGAWKWWRRR